MAGGEIHANIVETILTGRYPRSLPAWLEVVYLLALACRGGGGCSSAGAWAAAPRSGLVLFVAVAPPAFFAFLHDWVLPVAELQTG